MCGKTEDIALHQLNSLSNVKEKDKFESIRSQINRIQIPVCPECHQVITHGKYNDPKKTYRILQ